MAGVPGGPIFLFRYYSITIKTTKLQIVTKKIKKNGYFSISEKHPF